MPRIISAIITVQPIAKSRNPALRTPVATRIPAIASIGMQAGDHHPPVFAVPRVLFGSAYVPLVLAHADPFSEAGT